MNTLGPLGAALALYGRPSPQRPIGPELCDQRPSVSLQHDELVMLPTLSVGGRGQPTPGRPHLSGHDQVVVLLRSDEPLGPSGQGLAYLALFGLIESDFQGPKRAERQGPRGTACPG